MAAVGLERGQLKKPQLRELQFKANATVNSSALKSQSPQV
jgi:hypothetical protein